MRRPSLTVPCTRAARRVALACAAALCLLPAPALAAGDPDDELDRWVPALSTSIQILGQQASGSVESSDVLGTPLTTGGCLIFFPPPPELNGTFCDQTGPIQDRPQPELFPATSSHDTGVGMVFGLSAELMSPRLLDSLLSPRVFAHADTSLVLAFERNLAGERSPGGFKLPESGPVQTPAELAIRGQGSRAKSEVQPLLISAGIGVAFTKVILDRTLRIKPSFEYMWQEQKLIGIGHRAVKLEEDFDDSDDATFDDFRLVALDRTETEDQHGLGIGLEIEMDSGRLGPFMLSPFIWGRGYRVVGDIDYTFTVVNEDPDGMDPGTGERESVTYEFEFEPWVWRAGIGVRFRFVPE